ncbi:MAG: D-2-hydroxyacid dehydrogenase [Anaerolineales bacterium]
MTELVVLIGEDVGQDNLERMREAYPDVQFLFCPHEDDFIAAAPRAHIIFTKHLPAEAVKRASQLVWVQAGTAGVNHLLDAGLGERDLLLTNASGAHGVPMAELILGMMLAFATGLNALMRAQREHARVREEIRAQKFELEGQTLCVLGLGDIGGTLARKAGNLGMYVLGVRRSARRFPHVDEQYGPHQLLDIFPRADHVALCLPLTSETEGIVGERELRTMKSSAYIYNVGRGPSIDREALLRALSETWIAGAGLDVTDPSPLPDDSPLWDAPNVILSQHTSGSSPYNADRITSIFMENLGRYLRDEPLMNVVDVELGY